MSTAQISGVLASGGLPSADSERRRVQTNRQVAQTRSQMVAAVQTALSVKQLAASLGVSPRFIYQMRTCGFPMNGDTHNRQAATLDEARAWIKTHNFRLVRGEGIVGTRKKLLRPMSHCFFAC